MKCIFENCRHETDKHLVFDREDADGTTIKEAIAVCDDCVRVYLTALNERYRHYRIVTTNILLYGMAVFIFPALIFDIMRVPALVVCPVIASVCIPLVIVFRHKEIETGNDLIDGELDRYRGRAALSVLSEDNGTKYKISE